jgi:(E)-4-hydroxy-3-methylbut-2-enyl-diphosphate synthase
VGDVKIGSDFPVVKQTMTTTNTRDVESSVAQVTRIADQGGQMARLTVQGRFEADACMKIREGLWDKGYKTPLVADIHFAPAVAMRVAEAFEKIRVNPGNFADGIKSFENKVYDNREQFDADIPEIEKLFVPLVDKCKELGRAMRIGTNHGSLSARVMSFWGDSPRGMVESAVEFANICRSRDYHNFVFSMKASNPVVMVQAYRLLAAEMYKLGWNYPLHLGVTEAGEGEDGRMKSAIGIGTLLADGLGDTVRVSLTEDPEFELVPCRTLVDIGSSLYDDKMFVDIPAWEETSRDFEAFEKRRGDLPAQQDGDQFDVRGMMHRDGSVFSTVSLDDLKKPDQLYTSLGAKMVVGMPFKDVATSDSIYLPEVPSVEDKEARRTIKRLQDVAVGVLADIAQLHANPIPNSVAIVTLDAVVASGGVLPALPEGAIRYALKCTGLEPTSHFETALKSLDNKLAMIIVEVPVTSSRVHASRRVFQILRDIGDNGAKLPVIHSLVLENTVDKDELILRSGFEAGALLVDGMGDGVMIHANNPSFTTDLNMLRQTSFNLLQGCRMRSTKTDFVSCPSCGRTLFDLQEVTEQIKTKTGHLPGVSIAIMGCIVNGPGEMADADFGYVGGAPGKVDLYVGKEVVKRAIPNADACDALVDLIKENGRWVDKDEAGVNEKEAVSSQTL